MITGTANPSLPLQACGYEVTQPLSAWLPQPGTSAPQVCLLRCPSPAKAPVLQKPLLHCLGNDASSFVLVILSNIGQVACFQVSSLCSKLLAS